MPTRIVVNRDSRSMATRRAFPGGPRMQERVMNPLSRMSLLFRRALGLPSVAGLVGLFSFATPFCACSADLPLDASALLQILKASIATNPAAPSLTNDYASMCSVIDKLTTNWTVALQEVPSETNLLAQDLQEIAQFYFSGRKEYHDQTITKLLQPPVPIEPFVERTDVSRKAFARGDLELRLAFFRLLHKLGPTQAISKDPRMMIQGLARTYVGQLTKPYLSGIISEADLDVILDCVDTMPDITTNYCKELAEKHESEFPGVGVFAKRNQILDRAAFYLGLLDPWAAPEYPAATRLLAALLQTRPDLFKTRMSALHGWMETELSRAQYEIAGIGDWKEDLVEATNKCAGALRGLGMMLDEYRLNMGPRREVLATNAMSMLDLKYLTQINKYLLEPEMRFAIDAQSLQPKMPGDDQSGSERVSRMILNLKHPLALFVAYYQRTSVKASDRELWSLAQRIIDMRTFLAQPPTP